MAPPAGPLVVQFPNSLDLAAGRPRHKHELVSLSHQVNQYFLDLEPGTVGAAEGTEQMSREHCRCPLPHAQREAVCIPSRLLTQLGRWEPRAESGRRLLNSCRVSGWNSKPGQIPSSSTRTPCPRFPPPPSWSRVCPLAWGPLVTQAGLRRPQLCRGRGQWEQDRAIAPCQ